jgi:hypothetical protein
MIGFRGKTASAVIVSGALGIASLVTWAGIAQAASGGGYSPSQMDCQAFADDWATPQGMQYPGCHNLALNVESGGTTQGAANDTNTRYVEFGQDQMAIDRNSSATPTEYQIGYPGNTGSPHAGCAAVNTDGTGGKSAPASQKPVTPSQATNSQYGCGTNANGTGIQTNYDYYQWYCPIAAAAGSPCEMPNYGTTTLTVTHGTGVAYQPIVANGLLVYFGEDDNVDNTEHDGVGPYNNAAGFKNDSGAANGPSDGGAMTLSATPQNASNTPSLTHPEGLVNYSVGFCADGICAEVTTQQQTVNHGCNAPDSYTTTKHGKHGTTTKSQAPCAKGTPQNANVYDYAAQNPSVQSESQNCNGGGGSPGSTDSTTNAQNCGPGGMNAIRSAEPANENANPGAQVFADPDVNRSPAAPAPFWPTPGVYAGTCGVTAGSPALPTASAINQTPVGNGAGQVAVSTGC